MKKTVKLAAAGLVAMTVVGGTFAYWNATASIDNNFATGAYGGNMVEEFNPLNGQNWQPGSDVTKKVGVTNTGDYDIKARIKFEETWVRGDKPILHYPMKSGDEGFFPASKTADVADGKSVVYKDLDTTGWTQDGAWYVSGVIKPGETVNLLNYVSLLPGTVNGEDEYDTKTLILVGDETETNQYKEGTMSEVVTENGGKKIVITYTDGASEEITDPDTVIKQKVEKTLKEGDGAGYADAKYTLTITTQLSQVDTEGNALDWPAEAAPEA